MTTLQDHITKLAEDIKERANPGVLASGIYFLAVDYWAKKIDVTRVEWESIFNVWLLLGEKIRLERAFSHPPRILCSEPSR